MARTLAATLFLTAALSGLSPARIAAQARVDAPRPPAPIESQDANRTREALREILDRYPPSLRQVLRLDPTLLTKPDYLGLYPLLAAFLTQHPEVAHNPAFFIGAPGPEPNDGVRSVMIRSVQDMVVGLEVGAFFTTALFVVAWIARALMEHRRWIHAVKIQTDAHTKLVDRFATNEDLIAYVQSAAGQRFLTGAAGATALDAAPRAIAAPIGRILWSAQTGIVLALAGAGLWLARNDVIYEAGQVLVVFGTLLIAIGIGFVLSSGVSYLLSRQLGLLDSTAASRG
jgi:hypothetical protein